MKKTVEKGGVCLRACNSMAVRKLLFWAVLLLLHKNLMYAATKTAASVSQADVAAAVAASSAGDTVLIPAGAANWTDGISAAGITFIGAGADQTFITNSWTTAPTWNSLFYLSASASINRVSGLSIVNSSTPYASIAFVASSGQTNVLRVDNCNFLNISGRGVSMNGWCVGVVDNCFFKTYSAGGATGISITGEGDYSWNRRLPSWGDTNKVYIEDCGFDWSTASLGGNGVVDSYTAARYCVRYCNITNSNIGNHGTDSSGANRSTHSYEVYGNYFTNNIPTTLRFLSFRGGSGPIFSNACFGDAYANIAQSLYRATGTNVYGSQNPPCCNPWGPIDGVNTNDGNTDVYGYPALDQPGTTSPTTWHASTAPNGIAPGYVVQGRQPLFQWSNTCNGVLMTTYVGSYTNVGEYSNIPPAYLLIQKDRDYFDNTAMPDYTPLVHPHPLVTEEARRESEYRPASPFNLRVLASNN